LLVAIYSTLIGACLSTPGSPAGGDGGTPGAFWQRHFGQGTVRVAMHGNQPVVAGSFIGDIDIAGSPHSSEDLNVYLAGLTSGGELRYARTYGGSGDEHVHALAVDLISGHSAISGRFFGQANLGGETFENAIQHPHGFVAGFDEAGEPEWSAHGAASRGVIPTMGLSMSGGLRLLIGGQCGGNLSFDSVSRAGFGGDDAFLVYYGAGGDLEALQRWGTTSDEHLKAAIFDGQGAAFLVGTFVGTFMFGEELVGGDGTSLFIARTDPSGDPIYWALQSSATLAIGNVVAAVTRGGDLVLAGSFEGELAIEPQLTPSIQSAAQDVFVARIRADGSAAELWSYGGPGDDAALAIAIGPDDQLYVAGYFSGQADFAAAEPLEAAGATDGFLVVLDETGTATATRSFGGLADDSVQSIALAPDGSIYLGVQFRGVVDFGGDEPLEATSAQPHAALLHLGSIDDLAARRSLSR
jgi:hypothetical protein